MASVYRYVGGRAGLMLTRFGRRCWAAVVCTGVVVLAGVFPALALATTGMETVKATQTDSTHVAVSETNADPAATSPVRDITFKTDGSLQSATVSQPGWGMCGQTGVGDAWACHSNTGQNPGEVLNITLVVAKAVASVNTCASTDGYATASCTDTTVDQPPPPPPSCKPPQVLQNGTCVTPPCPPLTFHPATLPTGTEGQPYGPQPVTVTGGTGPYTFAVTRQYNPLGRADFNDLRLSRDGVFSGTPAEVGHFDSAYMFDVKVTDSAGCSGTIHYAITVYPDFSYLAPQTDRVSRDGRGAIKASCPAQGNASCQFSVLLAPSGTCSGVGVACTERNLACTAGSTCSGVGDRCSGVGTRCTGSSDTCTIGSTCTGLGDKCSGTGKCNSAAPRLMSRWQSAVGQSVWLARVTAAPTRLGTGGGNVKAGKVAAVRFKLSQQGLKLLKTKHHLVVRFQGTVRHGSKTTTINVLITLMAKR